MPTTRPEVQVSVLIPVKDEEATLATLVGQIDEAFTPLETGYEVIFVDDGSTDTSWAVMTRLAEDNPRVRAIRFRRNFGKAAALAAAVDEARGERVVTMDADLQDDPAMIPEFVARIRAGADLVSGWKQTRHDPIDKTLPSRVFNGVLARMSGVSLHDFNCGFKAYRIECVRELSVYGGFHRFLPVFASDRGFKVEELVVQHRARRYGHSKFGTARFIDGLLDLPTVLLITRYRTKPLHFFGLPGALLALPGIAILLYMVVLKIMGEAVGTRPLLTLGVLLTITGMQIVCVGLVAEVIVRTTMPRADVFAIKSVRRFGDGAVGRALPAPRLEQPESGPITALKGKP